MTNVELVNKILRRLREGTVSSVASNSYSLLIADFIDDIIKRAWDAHPTGWSGSRKGLKRMDVYAERVEGEYGRIELTVIDANDSGSALPGYGQYEISRYRNLRNGDQRLAVWGEESDGTRHYINIVSPEQYSYQMSRYTDTFADRAPRFGYFTQGFNNTFLYFDGSKDIEKWGVEWCLMPLFQPLEEDVSYTDTAAWSQIIPADVVFYGALWLALNERGEEIGEPGNMAERRYLDALGMAIERDCQYTGSLDGWGFHNDEVWQPVHPSYS